MLRSMTSLRRDIARSDVLLTVLFVVLALLFMATAVDEEGGSWAAVPVFALVAVPLLWRRVAPIPALLGLTAAVGLHVALFGTLTRCGFVFPVEFFLVFAAGARLGLRGALAGLADRPRGRLPHPRVGRERAARRGRASTSACC